MKDNNHRNYSISNDIKKLKMTKKSKINLMISIFLVTLFSIFFIMNIIIHSKLESIELKLYTNRKNYFFSIFFFNNDDSEFLKRFRIIIYIKYITLLFNIIKNHNSRSSPFLGIKK